MSQDQFLSLLRQILPVIGTLLVTMGVTTPDKFGTWTALIMQVAGPVFVLAGIIWSQLAHTKAATITAAANVPGVRNIDLDKDHPGVAALAAKTPDNVTAS